MALNNDNYNYSTKLDNLIIEGTMCLIMMAKATALILHNLNSGAKYGEITLKNNNTRTNIFKENSIARIVKTNTTSIFANLVPLFVSN